MTYFEWDSFIDWVENSIFESSQLIFTVNAIRWSNTDVTDFNAYARIQFIHPSHGMRCKMMKFYLYRTFFLIVPPTIDYDLRNISMRVPNKRKNMHIWASLRIETQLFSSAISTGIHSAINFILLFHFLALSRSSPELLSSFCHI